MARNQPAEQPAVGSSNREGPGPGQSGRVAPGNGRSAFFSESNRTLRPVALRPSLSGGIESECSSIGDQDYDTSAAQSPRRALTLPEDRLEACLTSVPVSQMLTFT